MGWLTSGGKAVVSGFKKLFKAKPTSVVTNGSGEVLRKTFAAGGARVISAGTAVKVALVGGAGYLFFTGGLSKTVAGVLGIPEWLAQFLVCVVVFLVIIWGINYIYRWFRRKAGFNRGYRRY